MDQPDDHRSLSHTILCKKNYFATLPHDFYLYFYLKINFHTEKFKEHIYTFGTQKKKNKKIYQIFLSTPTCFITILAV
jgi:hypothetical protein